MKKVIIIGPAYPLRGGGITTFNQRLAKQFDDEGYDCTIFSFSLQYPALLFPGKTQRSSEPPPQNLQIYSVINSIHPLNWLQVGTEIRRMMPDIVVVRYWLPFMGPALGTILRQVKKNKFTRIIAITDNIVPHEKRIGDVVFTRYFLKSCHAFITMSEKVLADLKTFDAEKPARQVLHPLYDNFGEIISKQEARKKLNEQGLKIEASDKIVLFFGFIRKYKGLDILLEATKLLKDRNPKSEIRNLKLLIAGEFYDDQKKYREQIKVLGIEDFLLLKTDFIPDNEVRNYLCAADVVVQPYRSATQSGVTPLAYHFEKPMIVTNVGGLPAMVPDGKAGIVCEPNASSIADAIEKYFALGESYFIPHLRNEKQKYSWKNLVGTIEELAEGLKI